MNWSSLETFVTLARAGSLSEAARRMKVTHATVSRHVSELEAVLGVKLFDRLPRGYVLTADGDQLLGMAERVEEGVFAIQRLARGQNGQPEGRVQISAPPAFASFFLAARLTDVRRRYPLLEIELIGESRAANLARREADIVIRLNPPEESALLARKVGRMGFGLYAAASLDHPDDRTAWNWVGYDDAFEDTAPQRWLRRLSASKSLVFRANDLISLWQAVRTGMGVGVLPCFLAEGDPMLVRQAVDGREAARDIWLMAHPDVARGAAVRVVMDQLAAVMRAEQPLLDGTL